jgi:histone H3/H4
MARSAPAKKKTSIPKKKDVKKPIKTKDFNARKMMNSIGLKVKLSNDAVQLLEDYFINLFTKVASKAKQIVVKAKKEGIDVKDV